MSQQTKKAIRLLLVECLRTMPDQYLYLSLIDYINYRSEEKEQSIYRFVTNGFSSIFDPQDFNEIKGKLLARDRQTVDQICQRVNQMHVFNFQKTQANYEHIFDYCEELFHIIDSDA